MAEETFCEKLISGEIAGKNQAIHAYDKLIWTIRSGFLTFWFGGWGILLKAIVDSNDKNFNSILLAMFLVSFSFSAGGFLLDINYVRRKFRVIHALDQILLKVVSYGNEIPNNLSRIKDHLAVSGDKKNENYLEVTGYPPALKAGLAIYLIPLITAVIVIFLLWKPMPSVEPSQSSKVSQEDIPDPIFLGGRMPAHSHTDVQKILELYPGA